jgi:MFS family permease
MIPSFLLPSEVFAVEHRALRLFWLDGLLFGVSTAFVYTFLPLFALAFGATASDLGLMSAISHLAAPLTFIAGAYLAERSVQHKRIYVVLEGLLGRGMLVVFALVPLAFGGRTAVWALIGVQVIRMTFYRLADPSRTVITGQIVPQHLRGRFMSARSLASSLGQLAIQPVASVIIARYLFPRGYQYSFAMALVAGLAGAFAFSRIPVPPVRRHPRSPGSPFQGWGREVWADRRFVAFLVVTMAWTLGDQVTRSFYSVHMVRNLGLDASTVGFLATATSLASLVGLPLIGQLSDRRGHRAALLVVGLTLALVNLPWLWARTAWQLLPLHLFTGLVYSSSQVIFLNLILAMARPERYARYSALHSAAATAMSVVGPLLGGMLFERVGFAGNLILASTVGIIAVVIGWGWIKEGAPQGAAPVCGA